MKGLENYKIQNTTWPIKIDLILELDVVKVR